MTEIGRLAKAITTLHGVQATHVRSEPVHEVLSHGRTAWDGTVEVFVLRDHPAAGLAYAWCCPTASGGQRYVAILGIGPITSAAKAVRAFLAAGASSGSTIDGIDP